MGEHVKVMLAAGSVGAGAMGGALYAFSAVVMRGLRALPPVEGVAAMRAINGAAPPPAGSSPPRRPEPEAGEPPTHGPPLPNW